MMPTCCISFVSYIKPQHDNRRNFQASSCISFVSYIKPQRDGCRWFKFFVVYLSFPTSNHNKGRELVGILSLYIFRFLHQTTTYLWCKRSRTGCISFVSYIKPQPFGTLVLLLLVVYLSFPTSNHNTYLCISSPWRLYIFRFLHQTTTQG